MSGVLHPRVHRLLGIAALLVAVIAVVSNVARPRAGDSLALWGASVLALRGEAAAAYDPAALAVVERIGVASADGLPFGYPPPFLLVLLPAALLPYGIAALGWIAASGAACLRATRALRPGTGWLPLSFPPVLVNAMIGQTGLLTGALMIGAAAALPRRPFVAGMLAGGLVIKPQLALLVPVALLCGRNWRAMAGAALSSLALCATALIAFGAGSYLAFLRGLPLFAGIVSSGLVGWHKMASVYAALRLAGLGAGAAWTIHLAVAIGAAAMVAIVWRGRHDVAGKAAALVAASMLVSPYLYVYDTVALIVPFLWLAGRGADRRLLAGLWLLPFVSIAQNWIARPVIDPMPLLPIALLALIARALRAGGAYPVPTASPTVAWPSRASNVFSPRAMRRARPGPS